MMIIVMIMKAIVKNMVIITKITLNILLLSFVIYRYTFMVHIIIMLKLLKVFVNATMKQFLTKF